MPRTIVIGAGVIGLACAHALKQRGREVILIDRDRPGAACSAGNAGWIVPSLSGPIAAPGLTATTIKWMTRSDSPLYIAPRSVPRLARWLWRFWRYCNRADYLRGLEAVGRLNRNTLALFDRLQNDGLEFEIHRAGLLFAFVDPGYMRAALAEFDQLASLGYRRPLELDRAGMLATEPLLSRQVKAGFLVEAEYHVRPESLSAAYAGRLEQLGATLMTGVEVTGAGFATGRARTVETTRGPIQGEEFLIAAGAWSGPVASCFGVNLPVQAGKGYSITLTGASTPLRRPLYLGEARVGCSPFENAIRIAGTMELSGINTVLNRRRVEAMRRAVRRYLDFPIADGTEWVGMRPITPDGLPLLGRLPGFDNVYIATGHAMLGVTLAPATAESMANLMTGNPAPELAPFEPGRFNW